MNISKINKSKMKNYFEIKNAFKKLLNPGKIQEPKVKKNAMRIIEEAIERMKPKNPIKNTVLWGTKTNFYECPECGNADIFLSNYCPKCGQALNVIWENEILGDEQ